MVMRGLQRRRQNKPIIFRQLTAFIAQLRVFDVVASLNASYYVACPAAMHQSPAACVRTSHESLCLFVTDSEIDLHCYITLAESPAV